MNGYSGGKFIFNWKTPPEYTESGGPIITLDLTLDCYGEEISWDLIDENNIGRSLISLSDENEYAMAYVTLMEQ